MQTDVGQHRASTQAAPSLTSSDLTAEARLRTARWAFRRCHGQCIWYLRADLEPTFADLPLGQKVTVPFLSSLRASQRLAPIILQILR